MLLAIIGILFAMMFSDAIKLFLCLFVFCLPFIAFVMLGVLRAKG